jgi:Ca2+-binding RTX toxin-like protein
VSALGPGLNVDINNLGPNGTGVAPDWWVGTPQPPPSGCSGATITGTAGNDNLVGTSSRDVIRALAGDDTLMGRQGNDELIAGPGTDKAYGGRGPDSLNTQDGVNGNDQAYGGKGSDSCTTDPGDTKVSC